MDSWILGLRGDDDTHLEFRALVGPSERALGAVEIYAFATSSLATAARMIDGAARALGYGTAALVPDEAPSFDGGVETLLAHERAASLCLTAAPGDFVLSLPAARAFRDALCFVRARRRPGWRLPLPCVALADTARLRSECRASAATLPEHPDFTGRDDERNALLEALALARAEGMAPHAVVRATPGMGATRLVCEAAARAGARVLRCVTDASRVDGELVACSLGSLDATGARWLIVEPRAAPSSLSVDLGSIAERAPGVAVIALVEPECETPWCAGEREVELGPLAPAESRALVRAMLGEAAEDMLVTRFSRRSGVPRELVALVRAAAVSGEIVRDGPSPSAPWRPRNRRLVTLSSKRAAASPGARVIGALDPVTRRALEVAVALGDGASVHALRGALRIFLGSGEHVATLRAHGVLTVTGETVDLAYGRSLLPAAEGTIAARVSRLRDGGVLEAAAAGERLLDERAPEAAVRFADAATAALHAGDRAAAARLLAVGATHARPQGDTSVEAATRALVAAIGALVVIEPIERPSTVSPEALDVSAGAREERGDLQAAARLRALAALLRGDSELAVQVGESGETTRDLLLGALAHAREAKVVSAVRAAVTALAKARREADPKGVNASLALLAAVYSSAGRADDASRIAGAITARG